MIYKLINLTVMGLFCALAAYSYGRYQPTHHDHSAVKPVPEMAKPVELFTVSAATAAVTRAHSHDARVKRREQCGEDYACIIAWAAEQHPRKDARRRS